MTVVESAWAAGFFDGEGCTVCVIQRSGSRSLSLTVGQVNRDNLERFRSAVGGVGRISRPYDKGHRPISRFRAYGLEAQLVLMRLWPHLGQEKRDQGLTALMRFAHRRVHLEGVCRRGHDMADAYVDPTGGRECRQCRDARRHRVLPAIVRPTALAARIGVREYTPPPYWLRVPPAMRSAKSAVAWTFGETADDYAGNLVAQS